MRLAIPTTAATLALAFGPAAAPVRADDWDDYRGRLEDRRNEQLGRDEDWLGYQ